MKKVAPFVLASILSVPVVKAEWVTWATDDNRQQHQINSDAVAQTARGYYTIPVRIVPPTGEMRFEVMMVDCTGRRTQFLFTDGVWGALKPNSLWDNFCGARMLK